ncbi:MAG: PAS domain-containing protein [Alphaproteobacteria bacterium]|nr:PAS domain-containing protein [Alphaproteobacteria bacterium]
MGSWPTLRRVFLHTVTVASPALAVIVVLMLAGAIEDVTAAVALVAVVVATAFLVWPYVMGVDGLRAAVARLEREGDAPPPDTGPSESLRHVWDAVRRMHGEREVRRAEVEAQLHAEEAILAALPDPLLLLDSRRRIVRANAAATALLGAPLVGRDLAAALRHPLVLAAADAVLAGEPAREVEFALAAPVTHELVARVLALAPGARGGGRPDGVSALVALHDVTAIKRAERMRADFVANASHELRTPLSTLVGFVETLQGPARDDEEARERFLAIMHEQAQRMARLVEDLLSLSRIEQEEHSAPTGRVDLGALARAAVETMEMKAMARGGSIDLVVEPDLPAVLGDGDQIAQVLQNLIDNASKYGRRGAPVTVTVARASRPLPGPDRRPRPAVAVAVADRGEGIAREHLTRLTERFYRVDPARSRALGGTGLGLAIVKHIVARHRGLLEIESAVGEGSTFTVSLPAAEPAAASRN